MQTDNLRISRTRPLLAPAILEEEIPLLARASERVAQSRETIEPRRWITHKGSSLSPMTLPKSYSSSCGYISKNRVPWSAGRD